MFIQQLFEGEIKRVIAIYPGRFQPFHLGHKEVFKALQAKFGVDNVFIGTSNKTDAVKSPFNFSDKLQLMTAAGVNNHHVIEVASPYMPDDYIRAIGFNPAETVLIFAVGAPDLKRLEVDAHYTALTPTGRPSKIPDGKSVGDPKPFKTFQNLQDSTTADQHQYVLIVNEREKKVVVNGKEFDASHGTQVRELWNEVRNDPEASAQVLQQLYGHATPELAHIFNKIPDANAAPAPVPAAAPKLKAVKQKNDPRYSTSMTQDVGTGEDKKNMKKLHLEGNRGYTQGFASPTAPSLGGSRRREDDEYHVPDPAPSTWYIRANGKIIKDKMGTPFQFRDKEAARKSAMTMMAKPFNAGKKFVLTTQPQDEAPVTESVTHRIGLTVTDPNHPMVSKRDETYHKTVRVTGDDREKAITGAIAHARRKGYKVYDHHYIGTVDEAQLDELSPKTLGSYTKKAAIDAKFLGHQAGAQQGDAMAHAKRPGDGADAGVDIDDRAHKRLKGVARAVDKLTGQGVAEGAPELLKKEMPLHRHAEKLLAHNGVTKDDPDYHHHLNNTIKHLRQFGNIDLINKSDEQGVAEGLPQTLRKVVPGYAKREIDKKMDAEKFGKTDVDRDANFARYKKIQDKLKEQDVNENAEELSVGDPVIISGQGIEFEGKTGDIDSFGDMKRFVVVNLYNHGKHSFHSSDVSYNDYADQEDDLDEDLYQYDKEDPYNSEFAPRAGMGRMTLRGWKQQMIRRTAELAQQMSAAGQDIDKSALWDNVYAKLKSMNMDPIAQEIEQAQAELEKIRQRGGVRSRAFNK